ncbi:hypothetical protein AB6A23_11215 [Paenibacillus tarimensis]
MLTIEAIDPALRKQLKEQRLRALQAQYFEFYMQKVALEANGKTVEAQRVIEKMEQTNLSYIAVGEIPTGEEQVTTQA